LEKKKRPEKSEDPILRHDVEYLKKHLDKLWEQAQDASERLQDIEVHMNLLTRLVTALCIEKLGMRIGVLKRMIKKIEKEVIQETQIHHLESLYKLSHQPSAKPHHPKGESEHRWEDIS
jgi:hypothetical protein